MEISFDLSGCKFSGAAYPHPPAARWANPEELTGAAVYQDAPASNFLNGYLLQADIGMPAAI